MSQEPFEEVLDQIREVLGLEATHYLVLASQVKDALDAKDRLLAEKEARIAALEKAICEYESECTNSVPDYALRRQLRNRLFAKYREQAK